MAKGDYDGLELAAMAERAADPNFHASKKALDALRVLPQLTAADLQTCIAFRLDPFSYLRAKQEEAENLARERQDRIERLEFHEREQRQRETWGGPSAVSYHPNLDALAGGNR